MPYADDGARRSTRTRQQTQTGRAGASSARRVSPASNSRSRYEQQRTSSGQRNRASQQYRQSSRAPQRQAARPYREQRPQGGRPAGQHAVTRAAKRGTTPGGRHQPSHQQSGTSIQALLSGSAVSLGIAAFIIIVLLVLVFAVLAPSCSGSPASPSDAQATTKTGPGLVQSVGTAKATAQAAVESANQVGSLETSNTKVEALVTLLGEEEAAKLVAQAKTDSDALWIAAHPDAYAFDGIEVQYKMLKLAADEPAAIKYVREFPAKYPMADADDDKSLAMDVASPSSAVPTTSIPHLYQWDRRWAFTIYSSATFGLTGCGPTSLAMVYQGLNKAADRTPHDMAMLAEERGYMSEYNGTDSSFFLDMAGELDLSCWDEYPDAGNIRDELSRGNVIIANLGPGYFTTNGHFFVLAGLTDDGQVIVNDPYSVVRSSQTWDPEFIAAESVAMFVFSKA